MNNREIKASEVYEAEFPFVRVASRSIDNYMSERWKPGFERRANPPDGGTTYTMATGMGKVFFEVIHVCEMPGRYMDRVFFKRLWIAPDGERLGGKRLEMLTIRSFRKRLDGYMPDDWDEKFRVVEEEPYV